MRFLNVLQGEVCNHHHDYFPLSRAKTADDRADSKCTPLTGSSAKHSDAKFKSDSENDEDDHLGDLNIIPAVGPVSEGRRISVSAQSVDPGHVKHQRSQLVIVEKTKDVTERLLQIVRKSPLLRALDEEQIQMIVKTFTGPIIKVADEVVIEQGDIGDSFYLLEDGSVDVFVQKKGETDRKQVHSYKAGDSFGELAIMYNAPRAATCIAHGECKLWALDRNSFRAIVVAAAMHKRETYSGFLSRVPILQTLTEMEIMTLADALREEQFTDGEAVCLQGDDGDYFYIIKAGTALCAQKGAEGKDKVVATLTAGNYFGGDRPQFNLKYPILLSLSIPSSLMTSNIFSSLLQKLPS